MEKARWLEDNTAGGFAPAGIGRPVDGGICGSAFMQQFPGRAKGFVSIDSAPLQRQYVTGAELYLLQRMEPVYRWYVGSCWFGPAVWGAQSLRMVRS